MKQGSKKNKSPRKERQNLTAEELEIIEQKKDEIKKKGRLLADSAHTTFFGKPTFHAYGNANTHPTSMNDYLKTHNINPHSGTNHPKTKQVYSRAMRGKQEIYKRSSSGKHALVELDLFQDYINEFNRPQPCENRDPQVVQIIQRSSSGHSLLVTIKDMKESHNPSFVKDQKFKRSVSGNHVIVPIKGHSDYLNIKKITDPKAVQVYRRSLSGEHIVYPDFINKSKDYTKQIFMHSVKVRHPSPPRP